MIEGMNELELIEFLKSKLSIRIETENEYDYNESYTVVKVSIILGDEQISYDTFSINK